MYNHFNRELCSLTARENIQENIKKDCQKRPCQNRIGGIQW